MAIAERIRVAEARTPTVINVEAARAVRQALELLGRASADWRNGTVDAAGPVHWPVAVHRARDLLQRAVEALDGNGVDLEDALRGSIWWNSISCAERHHWLQMAGSAVPAGAWSAYKAGGGRAQ